MRFPFRFSRFIGASTDPTKQLGQAADLTPNTAGQNGSVARPSKDRPVLTCPFVGPQGVVVQRLAIAYAYVGGGIPPAIPGVTIWFWDAGIERWFQFGTTFNLTVDKVIATPTISLADGGPADPGVGSLEAWISIPSPATPPDGEYVFLVGGNLAVQAT